MTKHDETNPRILSEGEIKDLRKGKQRISDYIREEFSDLAEIREKQRIEANKSPSATPDDTA